MRKRGLWFMASAMLAGTVTHASTAFSGWHDFPAITCMKAYTHQLDPYGYGSSWHETNTQQGVMCPIEQSNDFPISTVTGLWVDAYKDSANNGIFLSACTRDYTLLLSFCGAQTTQTINGYTWNYVSDLSAWSSPNNATAGWHYVFAVMPNWSRFNGYELTW